MNGFELYRMVSQKMDGVNKQTPAVMLAELRGMQRDRSKTFKDTKKLIETLDRFKDDYEDKIGEQIDESELTRILWQVMDDKSHEVLIAAGHEQYESAYEVVTVFVLKHF